MDLKSIFNAITPENIKNIPFISDAMDIFIQNLEENSKISKDISNVYDSDSDLIKEALIKTYLNSIYTIILKAQENKVIRNKLESSDLLDGAPLTADILKIINNEYLSMSKSFKQKLGTKIGINQGYNLAQYLSVGELKNDFDLTAVKPFHFKTDGTVFKEMYELIVKPLSHPVGFTFDYNQYIKESITDLFGIEYVYNFKNIEVRSFSDGSFDVFTSDSDDTNVKADFLTRINLLTGVLFTESQYNNQVTVYTNKVVQDFTEYTIENRNFKGILFTDGTYLEQYTNPIDVNYMYYDDLYTNNKINDYTSHSSLYINYELLFTFNYSDDIEKFEETFEVTKLTDENLIEQQYYYISEGTYAFNVGGDTYEFAPGIDETLYEYSDYSDVRSEIENAYTIDVNGSCSQDLPVTVNVTDGNAEYTNSFIHVNPDTSFNTSFNMCMFKGNEYTLTASVDFSGITRSIYITSSGLNDFENKVRITYFSNDVVQNVYVVECIGNPNTPITLTLEDSNGDVIVKNGTIDAYGDFSTTIDVSTLASDTYTLYADVTVGGKNYESYLKGNGFKESMSTKLLMIQPFNYEYGAPNFSGFLDYTALNNITEMNGFDSTSDYIFKQIGELVSGDYSNSDTYVDGFYTEGSDYDKSFFSNLNTEETFINYGRKIYLSDTSDNFIVTSDDYCSDDVLVYILSTSGYYMYTDELSGFDLYLYTSDGFYLTTLPNLE